jgi:hypothetical protein
VGAPSMCPRTTPCCHSGNKLGSVTYANTSSGSRETSALLTIGAISPLCRTLRRCDRSTPVAACQSSESGGRRRRELVYLGERVALARNGWCRSGAGPPPLRVAALQQPRRRTPIRPRPSGDVLDQIGLGYVSLGQLGRLAFALTSPERQLAARRAVVPAIGATGPQQRLSAALAQLVHRSSVPPALRGAKPFRSTRAGFFSRRAGLPLVRARLTLSPHPYTRRASSPRCSRRLGCVAISLGSRWGRARRQ